MRTNWIDGLILGLGISIVVMAARWLFGDTQILWQAAIIVVGALLLSGLQVLLDRMRNPRYAVPTSNETTPDLAAPVHSPPMTWETDRASVSVKSLPTLEPPINPPSSVPPEATTTPHPAVEPDEPAEQAEHPPEKMV
jgi:hypothetical protein